jgi:hypothetical protein
MFSVRKAFTASQNVSALRSRFGDDGLELGDRRGRNERSYVCTDPKRLYPGQEDINELLVRRAVDKNELDANTVLTGLTLAVHDHGLGLTY